MLTVRGLFSCVVVLSAALTAAAQPLPTDPKVVTGELANGLKYMVVNHAYPPGRAAVWIHVSTGSLNETDQQRGIAHYLEHMAFNGSENFPPGSVIPFFQSLGLNFGQHQNAFTSFDQTTYQLAFPDNKPETLDKGLKFFADVAGKMSLLPAEIDEERQIILEEKRARLSPQQRVQEYVLERIAPGSIVGQRLPIGVEQTILGVQQADFRDYYGRWYTPSNMTIMVVADMDAAGVVDQIKSAFNFGTKTPRPVDNDPGVKAYDTTRAIVATDPEITQASISIMRIEGARPPATTLPQLREQTVEEIAVAAFNRRIGKQIAGGGTPYQDFSASAANLFQVARWSQVSGEGKPEDWTKILTAIGADLQRARLHGFSAREIDDVKSEMMSGAERFVEQEKTLAARIILNRMNASVAGGEPYMSAGQELDAMKGVLPTITPAEVSKRFAEIYDTTHVTFLAELPASTPGLPSESDLIAAGRKALDVTPEPIAESARATALLEKTPTAGKIVQTTDHAASGVTSAWFENGVRVHHRFMDYKKDQVAFTISLATGVITDTAATRGTAETAGLAWSRPATSRLASTDVQDLMTGKKVNVGGGVGMDTATLSVSGTPADIESGLQLAHLLLTDPVIEKAMFEQSRDSQIQAIEGRSKAPQGVFQEAMAATVYPPGDARTQLMTVEQVRRVSLEAAQSWLKNTITTAPIEVAIVGDISRERALELASTYLGSLPKRDRISDKTLDDRRTLAKAKGPIITERAMQTQTPVAVVMSGFYGVDAENVTDTRLMNIASRIISTRMIQQIREKEQLAYSPQSASRAADEFPGFGVFLSVSPTDPSKIDRLVEAVSGLYTEFAASGPTEEEMAVARKQFANTMDEQLKEPAYWGGRLTAMTYRKISLDDVLGAADFYQNASAEQVKAAFAKYYKPESVLRVIVKPAQSESATPTTTGGAVQPAGQ